MKKWKIALIIVLFLILAGAGTVYYVFEVKEYDVADEELSEITTSDYTIKLPDEEEIVEPESESESDTEDEKGVSESEDKKEDESDSANEDQGEEESNKTDITSDKKKSENTSNEPAVDENQKEIAVVTVASIKKKYTPTFQDLESQANSKIDSLINKAISEYQAKKATGEEVSFGYFYSKYNGAGKSLEQKTDEAFYIAYNALQNELKKHGFSATHANEFKEAYDSEKSKRRTALLKKAMEKL